MNDVRFWDDFADRYSAMQQGDIPGRIVERLLELGFLGPDSSVLEIGSGPGTYSNLLAPAVGSLTCMDSSPRMLERLKASGCDADRILQDWNAYVPDRRFDCCIASLLPGSGSPESLMRMEACAPKRVLISWVENHGDDIAEMVWRALGKDTDFSARRAETARDWLEDNGRGPAVEYFETRIAVDMDVDDIVEMQRSAFLARGEGDVGDIVEDMFGCGTVHFEHTNRMRVVLWTEDRGLTPSIR